MKEDFKKGFAFGAGVIVALLIPTSIYFISSNVWKRFEETNEAKKEYKKELKKCIKRNESLGSSEAKKFCKKSPKDKIYQVPF